MADSTAAALANPKESPRGSERSIQTSASEESFPEDVRLGSKTLAEHVSSSGIPPNVSTSFTKQATIVHELQLRSKIFGLGLAFLAIVFVWESMDRLVQDFFPTHLALAYFFQMILSLLALWCITYFMRKRIKLQQSVSVSQNFLSLTTLSSAAASWSFMVVVVDPHLRKRSSHWVWLLGGWFFFFLQMLYSLYTRHYAFTEITSCVTSLGLADAEEGPPTEATSLLADDISSGRSCASNDISRRSSTEEQRHIVAKLDVFSRLAGIGLSFLAVVGLWEGFDRLVILYHPTKYSLLFAYSIIVLVGIVTITLSTIYLHSTIHRRVSTFCAEMCVGLSTLILAWGCWSCITTPVDMYVPKRGRTTFYVVFGTICFFMSLAYSQYTRHFALLDIASCVASLGVFDDDPGEHEDLLVTKLKSTDVAIRKHLLNKGRLASSKMAV